MNETLGSLLHKRRLAMGLSWRQMALRCRLTHGQLWQLESDSSVLPRRSTLELVAKGYGFSLEELALLAYGLAPSPERSFAAGAAVGVAAV